MLWSAYIQTWEHDNRSGQITIFLHGRATVGQWSACPSFDQGVGGSIVDVSLSKTLNPEVLPVALSPVYECNMILSRFV